MVVGCASDRVLRRAVPILPQPYTLHPAYVDRYM